MRSDHGRGEVLAGPRSSRDPPLAHLVYELSKITTHKAVSLLLGLHPGTVKAIDQAMMEKVQSERPLDGIDVLGFDEIAAGKNSTSSVTTLHVGQETR